MALIVVNVMVVFNDTYRLYVQQVRNLVGSPINVYWINNFVKPEKLAKQNSKVFRNGTLHGISSYEGHSFSVQFRDHIPGTEANITLGQHNMTVEARIDSTTGHLRLIEVDSHRKVQTLVDAIQTECLERFSTKVDIQKCMSKLITKDFLDLENSQEQMAAYHDKMATRLRNYTCADPELKTTEPISGYDYHFLGKTYKVNVFLETEKAKIWAVENFLTEAECEALMNNARPRLAKATVADGLDGTSTYSVSRKAQQAGYKFRDDVDKRSDFLW
jgi:hypothetical protein